VQHSLQGRLQGLLLLQKPSPLTLRPSAPGFHKKSIPLRLRGKATPSFITGLTPGLPFHRSAKDRCFGRDLQPSLYLASRSVRSNARLFLPFPSCVPYFVTPGTDSPAESLRSCLCPARYAPLRSASSLRRDCPHSAPASLQRTDSATLRGFPRSHQSLPADSSFVADCFQSLLPLPLQTAPLPLRCSPRVGGRTRPCVGCSVLLLFEGLCMLAYTVLPRFNLSAALACRGLRPCLLYYLCQAVVTAIAVTPSCPKQQRPSLLTYA